jgi:methionine-rich copper-binding protein CopC
MYKASRGIGKSLARAVPPLAIGLAAGVTGGIAVAGVFDTTPYDEVQFNTATRNAHQAGSAEGWEEAQQAAAQTTSRLRASNAERLGQLVDRVTEWRSAYQKAQKQAEKKATAQHSTIVRLQGSLAETTASLNNATNGSADGHAVTGTVRFTTVLRAGDKPWPTGCAQPLRDYQVRVTAGDGATVATAGLVGAEVTKRSTRQDVLTLACSLSYTADLPTPLGSGYEFVAVRVEHPEVALDTEHPSDASLRGGSVPALSVSE